MAKMILRTLPALLVSFGLFAWAPYGGPATVLAEEDPHADEHAADGGDHSHDEDADHADGGGSEHGHGEGSHEHHAHAGPASNHPLSVDPDLAWVTLAIFVCLLLVLRKFAWGPIMEGLAKREKGISDDIDAAAARRKEAEKMLSEYQTQLERAGDEVRAMLDNAKKEAEEMKQSIIEEANKAAAAEKDRATREIDAAKNSAINEIAEHSVNIAFRVASGAVQREIKADDHRNLIEDALKQFSNDN